MDRTKLILQEQRVLSPGCRWFRFATQKGESLSWLPGHFYRLEMEDDRGRFERSYSVANLEPSPLPGTLDLLIAPVAGGRATSWFWSAKKGASLLAKGPYGRLLLPSPLPKRLLLVATSVGLAPYLPMLARLCKKQAPVLVELLLGVRGREEFLHASEILAMLNDWPEFRLHLAISRDFPAQPADFEYSGRVQQPLFEGEIMPLCPRQDLIYLCGNPHMIDDIFPRLKALGFTGRRVLREKYVFARDEVMAAKPAAPTSDQKALIQEKLRKLKG